MSRYIVFLRGVMPTGRTKVPTAQARAALIKTGFIGVRSQIASGNFLLDCQELGQETKAGCEARVAAQVQAVIARDARTLELLVHVKHRENFDCVDKARKLVPNAVHRTMLVPHRARSMAEPHHRAQKNKRKLSILINYSDTPAFFRSLLSQITRRPSRPVVENFSNFTSVESL